MLRGAKPREALLREAQRRSRGYMVPFIRMKHGLSLRQHRLPLEPGVKLCAENEGINTGL